MGRVAGGVAAVALFLPILLVVILGGGGCVGGATGVGTDAVSVDTEQLPDVPNAGLSSDPEKRAEQIRNAAFIMNAATEEGLPVKAQIIGVQAALGESTLINVDYGDDIHGVTNPDGTPTCSLGLFQQQWCLGWGTKEEVMDPSTSAKLFFRALAKVEGWTDLEPTIAIHRVQRNDDPWHYERHWETANTIVGALAGIVVDPSGTGSAPSCAVDTGAGSGAIPVGWAEPGPWGGHQNGRIPDSQIKPLPWAPGHRLRADAADALIALNNAYRAQFGRDIAITDAYRDYDTQVILKAQKGGMAATPGTSFHGWALAVDLGGGINRFGTPQHVWMKNNAPAYGWILPAWADAGGDKPEPWHWEFWGVRDDA